jgi:glycosyltransferase involved in cell wall biosynthesis
MPNTIIGVVAHNNADILDPLLRSLHAFTTGDVGYVFVDNGSEDGTGALFGRFLHGHDGHLRGRAENEGCNQGWNLIFEKAMEQDPNPQWLILLNSDIQVLRPGWNEELTGSVPNEAATCEALGVLHHFGGELQHVGSAATAYRFSALFELWAEDKQRRKQTGPWDVENFPGWEGDIDVFNALQSRGWLPSLARQGVHVLHLCGRTECALREGEEFKAYQRAARLHLLKKWNGDAEWKAWWGHRAKLGATRAFRDGVDEAWARELYPWL